MEREFHPLYTEEELGHLFGYSARSIKRFANKGMPYEKRKNRRVFDVRKAREWMRLRGKKTRPVKLERANEKERIAS